MKRLMLLTVSVLLTTAVVAQFRIPLRKQSNSNSDSDSSKSDSKPNSDNSNSSFRDRIYFSMGGGFGSGTNGNGIRYSYYSLLPTVGYRVQTQFLVALRF